MIISQKVFIQSFCKSQFLQKFVNLSFILVIIKELVIIKDKLTEMRLLHVHTPSEDSAVRQLTDPEKVCTGKVWGCTRKRSDESIGLTLLLYSRYRS